MESTLEHPLAFFDWYLNKEIQNELKDFYRTIIEEMYFDNIKEIDKETHTIKVNNVHHKDEIDSDFLTWTFEGSIRIKLNKEINHSLKLIESGFLNRYIKSNEVKAYAEFLRTKINMLLSQEAFQKFPFLQTYFDKIINTINNYSIKPTINHFVYSFNLLVESSSEQTIKIVKLYDLLTISPSLINCTKEEFINAFTGLEVQDGIHWLVKGKSKLTSKGSLFYFVYELINSNHLSRNLINDLNKHVKYVFRDSDGNELKNLKQSKATISNNPSQKDRIDSIISSL